MTAAFLASADPEAAEVLAKLSEEIALGEKELQQQLCSDVDLVQSIGLHTLNAGGKRLRPALVTLSAAATSNEFDASRTRRLGACMELIHMATLVHDDVIDEAKTRRGVPTAASIYGNTAAILSGDVMLAKAMRILALDGDLEIIQRVSSVVVDLAEGETLELSHRGNLFLSKYDYFEVLRRKTATFIECCCSVGAMAAKAKSPMRHALESFGLSIGMAFQIADDLLDYCGDSMSTGKPKLADFQEGCATLPLIEFMQHSDGPLRDELAGYFGKALTELEGQRIYNLMSQSGAFRSAESEAMKFVCEAKDALDQLPNSPEVEVLRSVSDFVVLRSK